MNTRALILLIVLLPLTACSMFGREKDDKPVGEIDTDEPAAMLYDAGYEARMKKNYDKMIRIYETLESRYPFGPYAQQARLEMAYGHYRRARYEACIDAIDQFLKLYPRHPNLDYAYYLQGLCNFHQLDNMIDRLLERNIASMDNEPIQSSFTQFKTLVENFPDSKYTPDARQRMIYLRNMLADNELEIARFYASRGAWAAVAKRASYVIENYHNANAMPEALQILVEAYDQLGLEESRDEALEVLKLNYPDLVDS